jgi:hypothetical protein
MVQQPDVDGPAAEPPIQGKPDAPIAPTQVDGDGDPVIITGPVTNAVPPWKLPQWRKDPELR